MTTGTSENPERHPARHVSALYGYDSPVIQHHYLVRHATQQAAFFLPHLHPGMTLLDCGCGPGAITLGLAEAVAPGQVVGVDREPSMVARACALVTERHVAHVRFQVGDVGALPFPASAFDAVFTCAVLEHLSDPVQALQEMGRVLKPGGLVGVTSTDWSAPLISPPDPALHQFFTLFERGFQHHGGSLQRGRHLRSMLRQAGLTVLSATASCISASTPEAVRQTVDGYIAWIAAMPLFEQAIALGWIDRPTLEDMCARMRQWSTHPDAFLATLRCEAVGQKAEQPVMTATQ
jgi:ubiquinone/menaquinone biosynthesis C-methylase UbiE